MHRVTAIVVNWNSGKDLARVVEHLAAQQGVALDILVVDNDSKDDSVARAQATGVSFRLEPAGANLGYAGGNNFAAALVDPADDIFIVNPDVRLPDARTVARLVDALAHDSSLGAVAPAIQTERGCAEYLDSEVDFEHARAVHIETNEVFPDDAAPRVITWIDGAALLVRGTARKDVGLFDERFFLFFEEVDFSLRLQASGWQVALCPAIRVRHRRSSSFTGSTKGAYYYWRNLYLICSIYASSRAQWRWHWTRQLLRYVARRRVLFSGSSVASLRGGADALRGRFGPGRVDR